VTDHFWYVTIHPSQLNFLPSAGQEISTGQNAILMCGWGVKAGVAYSICGLID